MYPAKILWQDGFTSYRSGEYGMAWEHYTDAFLVLQYEGLFLQHSGKCLAQLRRYDHSNLLLSLAADYYNDPVLYTTMGTNFTAMQQYEEAEKAFSLARNMIPHRFYPGYLQAQMYYTSRQREKAATLANQLLKMEVKIQSPATDEMLRELRILSNIYH